MGEPISRPFCAPFYVVSAHYGLHPFAPSTLIGTPADPRIIGPVGPEKMVWVGYDYAENPVYVFPDPPEEGACPQLLGGCEWIWVKEVSRG